MTRAAVIGHPVAHSLSPALHSAAYDELGLAGWSYGAIDCREHELAALIRGLDASWAGLSVTMPLKKAVIPLLDAVSPLAVAVGAVNTVTFPSGSAPDGAVGDNTDVYGLACALRECGHACIERALILGGGATTASTLAALLDLGCREPIVGVRSAERVRDSLDAAERLDVHPRAVPLADAWECLVDVDVVVSTVPIDASAGLAASLDAGVHLPSLPTLLDVVYAPWPTPLAHAWQRHGGRPVGGLAMLLHQAVAQVQLMTGRPGPVEVMRAAGERELLRRSTEQGPARG